MSDYNVQDEITLDARLRCVRTLLCQLTAYSAADAIGETIDALSVKQQGEAVAWQRRKVGETWEPCSAIEHTNYPQPGYEYRTVRQQPAAVADDARLRARDLLASEYDRVGYTNSAQRIREREILTEDDDAAIRAIAAALSTQPAPSAQLAATIPTAPEWPGDGWLKMDTAPRDGTLIRLLVDFTENATEDSDRAPTIGSNSFDNTGHDQWDFAGWSWAQDCYTQGEGTPVGWLPMLVASEQVAASVTVPFLPNGSPAEWQDNLGRWWPVTITDWRSATYSARLDDGTDALRYPVDRFRAPAPVAPEREVD